MMDDGGADVTRDQVRRAVKQAILLNEHLLRRAWGLLYVGIALSMSFSAFGVPIIDSLLFAKSLRLSVEIAMDLTASGSAWIVILWAFKRVRNAAEITQPEGDRAWSRLLGYRFLVPLWVTVNGISILTLLVARSQVPLVRLLVLLGSAVYLYYALRLSFAKKIPGESLVAIGSLSLSSIASIALLSVISSTDYGLFVLLDIATIVAWIFSGVYARTRPVPEFEEERTGLE